MTGINPSRRSHRELDSAFNVESASFQLSSHARVGIIHATSEFRITNQTRSGAWRLAIECRSLRDALVDNHSQLHMFCRPTENGLGLPIMGGPRVRPRNLRRMFVCICNALRDRELKAAAIEARGVAEVFRRCGKRPQCGKCLPDVAQMIEDARPCDAQRILAAE